jgi:ribulose-phosphate 3-epimerase
LSAQRDQEEPAEWKNIQNEEAAMPYWEELNFEAHLMTKDVATKYEEWVRAGIERLVVHYEAFETSEELSNFLGMLRTHFGSKEGSVGIEIGLAANFQTSADLILPHVLEADFVHLMAVGNLGLQGEVFDEGIFDKIEKIKYLHPDTILSVDGGVTANNIKRLADAGVSRVCVGSAIFAATDPAYALEELQSVL